jgi:TPR repeat protein
MVAIEELRGRLTRLHARCREGIAVIRAAIDWRRAGAQRPLRAGELDVLYRLYLPNDLDHSDELFTSGLSWAREPLPNTGIALLRKSVEGAGGYEPYDLAVEVACEEWPGPGKAALAQMIGLAEPLDCFQMAGRAYDAEDVVQALELLAMAERSEDRQLAATSAFNRGVLLGRSGDPSAAEAAYRRADERGSMRGAFNLGQMLRHRGDLADAEAAYHRADERGSPEGAVNLGVLLERRGDPTGAEGAYRRADLRGSPKGARNLARLRATRHDPRDADAEAALIRAGEVKRVEA